MYSDSTHEAYVYNYLPINFNKVITVVTSIKDISMAHGEYSVINKLTNIDVGVIFGAADLGGRDATEFKNDLNTNKFVHILLIGI